MRRAAPLVLLFFLVAISVHSQAIHYAPERKIWLLSTAHSSYAIGVSPEGQLQNLYWGGPLWRLDDIAAAGQHRDLSSFDPRQMLENEEYAGWGGPRFYEPALKLTRADGNRDLVLHYQSHQIKDRNLDIVMRDIGDELEVILHYR